MHKDRQGYQSESDALKEIQRTALWSIPFGAVWLVCAAVHAVHYWS